MNEIIIQQYQMKQKILNVLLNSFVYKDFIRQGLIVTIFSSSCSTIRTTTVTSLTSTISLPVSSKYK
ncbi:unnamed protein product [Rotaria sordida]|uniref:Uncharacterized protein n=1 Tax=Rotaria sordida TaxID=392033 RepID=A0A820A2E7_9BILA|nr:unnamed protein product [Rotaria sordida]